MRTRVFGRGRPLRALVPVCLALLAQVPVPASLDLRIEERRDPQDPDPPGIVFVSESDKIIIRNIGARYTCCYAADARIVVEGERVEIHERNSGGICKSICPFDFKYSIWGLAPGEYEFALYRDDGTQLGAKRLPVGPKITQPLCDPSQDEEAVSILAEAEEIRIRHENEWAQCCLLLDAQVSFGPGQVTVSAVDRSPAPCECHCSFDLEYAIPGLEPGVYRVDYVDLEGVLISTREVTLSGPRTITTQVAHSLGGVPPEEEIRIFAEGDDVVVERRDATEQCCLDLELSVRLEDGLLEVLPRDRGPPCDCLARFLIRLIVLDLPRGSTEVLLRDLLGEEASRRTVILSSDPLFLRGVVTPDDWTIGLTDAVLILGHLFLGDPETFSCREAADTNDDARIDLADAVYLLDWLFLGGTEPPPPFPHPGLDLTGPPLGCDRVPCIDSKLMYERDPWTWDAVEFCIPPDPAIEEEVRSIYPEVRFSPGAAGSIGCGEDRVLCRIAWVDLERSKACRLASLPYVMELLGARDD